MSLKKLNNFNEFVEKMILKYGKMLLSKIWKWVIILSIVAKKIYIIMFLGTCVHAFINEEEAKKELKERNKKTGKGFTLEVCYLQFPKEKKLEDYDFEVIGFED